MFNMSVCVKVIGQGETFEFFKTSPTEKYKVQLTIWGYKVCGDGGLEENAQHELVKYMLNSALFIHSSYVFPEKDNLKISSPLEWFI